MPGNRAARSLCALLGILLCVALYATNVGDAHAASTEPTLVAASTQGAQEAAARIAALIKGSEEVSDDAGLLCYAFHAIADDARSFAEGNVSLVDDIETLRQECAGEAVGADTAAFMVLARALGLGVGQPVGGEVPVTYRYGMGGQTDTVMADVASARAERMRLGLDAALDPWIETDDGQLMDIESFIAWQEEEYGTMDIVDDAYCAIDDDPEDFVEDVAAQVKSLRSYPEGVAGGHGEAISEQPYATPVRNQGDTRMCWAFAALAAIEFNVLKSGNFPEYDRESLDLSERHLGFFTYDRDRVDPLGYITGAHTLTNNARSPYRRSYIGFGAYRYYAEFSLSTWDGPALESDAPFNVIFDTLRANINKWGIEKASKKDVPAYTDFLRRTSLDESLRRKDALHVAETRRVSMKDIIGIKELVYTYGCAECAIYMISGWPIYNKKTASHCYSGEYHLADPSLSWTNHCVDIVGWDDDYPRENFSKDVRPKRNGAFLVRNSWGDKWGQKGYFWVSYEDSAFKLDDRTAVAFILERPDTLDYNYQMDGTLSSGTLTVQNGGALAHVFEVRGSSSFERLEAVSVNLATPKATCTVQVYRNPKNPDDPTSGTALLSTPQSKTTDTLGCIRIDLSEKPVLRHGDTFAVVVKLTREGSDPIRSFCSYSEKSHDDWHYSPIEPCMAFRCDDLSAPDWLDLFSLNRDGSHLSARIKAYTTRVTGRRSIEGAEVAIDDADGRPRVTVSVDDEVLTEGEDYAVAGVECVGDEWRVTIEGENGFEGETQATLTVDRWPVGVTVRDAAKRQGQPDPAFGAVATTLAEGHALTRVTCEREPGESPGRYRIDVAAVAITDATGKDVTEDYDVYVASGTLEILAAGTSGGQMAPATPTTSGIFTYGTYGYDGSTQATTEAATNNPSSVVSRLFGQTRYDTMAKIVALAFDRADWVIVASGEVFPDALTAAALAGAHGAPVVLTERDRLTPQAAEQIGRLGASHALIVGGTAAVSDAVEEALTALCPDTSRVHGADRARTSVAVLRATRALRSASDTVFVASGDVAADALSIGPMAYAGSSPVVLCRQGILTDEAVEAIRGDNGLRRVVLVGGASAVSDEVRVRLGDAYEYVRLGGADRYETSARVAAFAVGEGLAWSTPVIATGRGFADALAGAPYAASLRAPLLLVDTAADATVSALRDNAASVRSVRVLGGPQAVSDAVVDAIATACEG